MLLILGMAICISGCNSSNQINKKDKENINTILQTIVTQKKNFIIDELIYIHVMELDDIHYCYSADSKPEKIITTGAYEIKLKSSNNYIYVHAYMKEGKKFGFVYNKETMQKYDAFYFTNKNGDRLKYHDIDKDYLNNEIIINF